MPAIPLVPMGNMAADAATSAAQNVMQTNQQTQQNNPLELLGQLLKSNSIPQNVPLTTTQTQINAPAPLVPRSSPVFNYDQREFATGSGNRRVAAQNLFKSMSSIVNNVAKQREEKQTRTLQNDLTRMFGAMEGMQQAQASGDKDAVAHNKQIISDILGDPKKAKQIEKAFDINLLGDQKNPTENKALMRAYAEWQKGGQKGPNPVAEKASTNFQKAMPQIQGMNPALIAAFQRDKMNKEVGGITDKDRLDTATKVATTQMVVNAHKLASELGAYGRIATETQRGINETNKVLLQNMGKSDTAALDSQEKSVDKTIDMLRKSLTSSQKALKDIGSPWFNSADRAKKDELEKDVEGKQSLIDQYESIRLSLTNKRGGANAGNTDSSTKRTPGGAGNTNDKTTNPPKPDRTKGSTGETLGLPAKIYDEFYKQFWSDWFGGSNNDDPYAGKKPI